MQKKYKKHQKTSKTKQFCKKNAFFNVFNKKTTKIWSFFLFLFLINKSFAMFASDNTSFFNS